MRYVYCPIQDKVVPYSEKQDVTSHAGFVWSDEMPPTKNPINPKQVFTSKKLLRAEYKAHGAIEIGDAYERGYSPEKISEQSTADLSRNLKYKIAERLNYGRR
jgi:hypothetical protein